MSPEKLPAVIRLPDEARGWKAMDTDHRYKGQELYDYIDGGGELYLSYGFKLLVSRKYSKPGQPDIILDFFDMGSSRNAFGVFSQSREKIEKDAGQGSEYAAGQMIFWKDCYYISVMSQAETPESKKAVFELAHKVADMIPGEGQLPDIISRLPSRGLISESIRYFRHHAWLNSHYFIADQNILHIHEKTEAVLAKYGKGLSRIVLLLIEYPDEKEAGAAKKDFIKYYLPETAGGRSVRIEDGTFAACELSGALLIAVLNAPSERSALRLIDDVKTGRKKAQNREVNNE
jgi:hypothetical protein